MKRAVRTLLGVAIFYAAIISASAQDVRLTIAAVDNGDMIRMQKLSGNFTASHPNIALNWNTLDENTLRQQVTIDIATGGGQFDVVTIGTFEASIRAGLSLDGTPYAVPFQGESAFT